MQALRRPRSPCGMCFAIPQAMHSAKAHTTLSTVVSTTLALLFIFCSLPARAAEVGKKDAAIKFGEGQYRLGPEDVIEVFVWKEPDLSTTVVVRPDGRVSLPLTGEVE